MQKSRLLYNLNKTDLRMFVRNPSDKFLVTFYAQNRTLDMTEPLCKLEALNTLLFFGKHYS